ADGKRDGQLDLALGRRRRRVRGGDQIGGQRAGRRRRAGVGGLVGRGLLGGEGLGGDGGRGEARGDRGIGVVGERDDRRALDRDRAHRHVQRVAVVGEHVGAVAID